MRKVNQAVILCAGKGERMGEKFKDIQKCTLIIKGKPLIFQSVANLVEVGLKHIAPTHARIIYDENFTVINVKQPDCSEADIWIGMDLCQPYLLDCYCKDEQKSQLDLARAILNNGETIKVVPYSQPWVHIVTPGDVLNEKQNEYWLYNV